MQEYKGVIIDKALTDNRLINHFDVCKVHITNHEKPSSRWIMFEVLASLEQIEMLKSHMKKSWYIHFWKDDEVIALFKGKSFTFNYSAKSTWSDVLRHGKLIGIPEEQLDFPIEGL